jgi:hypothetical protein
VHPNDQYVRAIGRSVAKNNAKDVVFKLMYTEIIDEQVMHLTLKSEEFEIILRVHKNSDKVFLINSYKLQDNYA